MNKRFAIIFLLKLICIFSYSQNDFISVWNTAITTVNTTKANQIQIPFLGESYSIYWENINNKNLNGSVTGRTGKTLLTMPEIGIYLVKITPGDGPISGLFLNEDPDRIKLLEIRQWGKFKLHTFHKAFMGCRNLKITAIDFPDVSENTSMYMAFDECDSLTAIPNIHKWNTSKVTTMYSMFHGCEKFDQALSGLNTSNVTDMGSMLSGCKEFNQSINDWDVSRVTNMNSMFFDCKKFNQPLHNWNVKNVKMFVGLFSRATSFNQPLNEWNVSGAENMYSMFSEATSFNQPINQWDVSNVENFQQMFDGAESFNQELGRWKISQLTNFKMAFDNSGLDSSNYSKTLIGWANSTSLPSNIILDAKGKKYLPSAEESRSKLLSKGWKINDGGLFLVNFKLSELKVIRQGASLLVNWNVEGDIPYSKYFLEIREDKNPWKRIGNTSSKTRSDYSNTNNSYQFVISEGGNVSFASVSTNLLFLILTGSIVLLQKNRKPLRLFSFFVFGILILMSCSRSKEEILENEKESSQLTNTVDIRIVAVNEKGSETSSNVVTVENFNVSKF